MFVAFIVITATILAICLAVSLRSVSRLQDTVDHLRYRAQDERSSKEYYLAQLNRRDELARESAASITRAAVEREREAKIVARETRLNDAHAAAEAIRARTTGGKS